MKNNSRFTANGKEVYKVYLLEDESMRNLYQNRINKHLQNLIAKEEIEKEWQNIQQIIKESADEAVGRKKKFQKRKGLKIWNYDIEKSVKLKQKRYKTYLDNPTENHKEEYKKVKTII